MRERITALHGEKTMRISAVRSEAGPGVFRKVLAGKGYRTILEIGTYRGCAAAEMAQYCDKVITIDLKFGAIERRGGKFDRVAFWRSLGVNNIELHLVDNDVEKVALVNGLDFDFAFVDGGHDANSVRTDFALVKRCGHVLLHDYSPPGEVPNWVYEFINTLPKEQIEVTDIFAMWTAPA